MHADNGSTVQIVSAATVISVFVLVVMLLILVLLVYIIKIKRKKKKNRRYSLYCMISMLKQLISCSIANIIDNTSIHAYSISSPPFDGFKMRNSTVTINEEEQVKVALTQIIIIYSKYPHYERCREQVIRS